MYVKRQPLHDDDDVPLQFVTEWRADAVTCEWKQHSNSVERKGIACSLHDAFPTWQRRPGQYYIAPQTNRMRIGRIIDFRMAEQRWLCAEDHVQCVSRTPRHKHPQGDIRSLFTQTEMKELHRILSELSASVAVECRVHYNEALSTNQVERSHADGVVEGPKRAAERLLESSYVVSNWTRSPLTCDDQSRLFYDEHLLRRRPIVTFLIRMLARESEMPNVLILPNAKSTWMNVVISALLTRFGLVHLHVDRVACDKSLTRELFDFVGGRTAFVSLQFPPASSPRFRATCDTFQTLLATHCYSHCLSIICIMDHQDDPTVLTSTIGHFPIIDDDLKDMTSRGSEAEPKLDDRQFFLWLWEQRVEYRRIELLEQSVLDSLFPRPLVRLVASMII
jgi:hypothetical protein